MMLNAIEAMQDAGVTVRLPQPDGQLLFCGQRYGTGSTDCECGPDLFRVLLD